MLSYLQYNFFLLCGFSSVPISNPDISSGKSPCISLSFRGGIFAITPFCFLFLLHVPSNIYGVFLYLSGQWLSCISCHTLFISLRFALYSLLILRLQLRHHELVYFFITIGNSAIFWAIPHFVHFFSVILFVIRASLGLWSCGRTLKRCGHKHLFYYTMLYCSLPTCRQ